MPDSSHNFPSVRCNHKFYLPGGDIYFSIEDERFRVHNYFFERESTYFAQHFNNQQGINDSTAIALDGVSPSAFESFLGVFYNPKFSVFDYTTADWKHVLQLSHQWGFPEVKNLAVRQLEKVTDLRLPTRISIYQQFDIDRDILLHYYEELCRSPFPLTLEESRDIGLETSVMIFHARERLRAQPSDDGGSPLPVGRDSPEDVRSTIVELLDSHKVPSSATNGPARKKSTTVNGSENDQAQKVSGKKNGNGGQGKK